MLLPQSFFLERAFAFAASDILLVDLGSLKDGPHSEAPELAEAEMRSSNVAPFLIEFEQSGSYKFATNILVVS